MLFSTLIFVFGFLPLFLAAYFGVAQRWRNPVVVLAGILFYAWAEPVFVLVLLAASIAVWGIGLRLHPSRGGSPGARRGWLVLGLGIALGLLVVCKYANFIAAQLNLAGSWLALGQIPWVAIALPVGVSFFSFQKISYLLDVYRGTTRPAASLGDFLVYVLLFPQLIAGPIIRYHDLSEQISGRSHRAEDFLEGFWRFVLGLSRKVLIANPLGLVADRVFAADPELLPLPQAWLGLLCYAFQIYFDFAGYSDMAIGLARMMGFRFPENFDLPYTARSVTEFWRRWHISLSAFMREYLYIPLGGSRGTALRTSVNLWLVFLASGFWHGASWSFVVWGAWHGLLLSAERIVGRERLARVPALPATAGTFLLVCLGWVVFRADTLPQALRFYARLVDFGSIGASVTRFELLWPELMSNRSATALCLAAVFAFLPAALWSRFGLADAEGRSARDLPRLLAGLVLFLLSVAALSSQSFNPFIYTRF